MTSSKTCSLSGETSVEMSLTPGVCAACVARPDARATLCAAHAGSRWAFGFPVQPARQAQGVRRALCTNGWVLGEGERGFRTSEARPVSLPLPNLVRTNSWLKLLRWRWNPAPAG